MIWIRNICITCILAAMSGGCVVYESGEKIDPTLVARIKRDVSTRADVEAMFGPPMRIMIVDVGERMLRYSYRQVIDRGDGLFNPHPGTWTRHQTLLIWTGKDNRIKDFEFSDYLTDRTFIGTAEVVKRAAVSTQPSQNQVWFMGGED